MEARKGTMRWPLALAPVFLLAGAGAFGSAWAVPIAGVSYPERVELADHALALVGVGLREVTVFRVDVYTLAVYAPRPTCDLALLPERDEPSLLRLDFLRHVSAEQLRRELGDSFARRMPADAAPELRTRVQAFLALLDGDTRSGTRVEVSYEPGAGTRLLVDGAPRGTVPGADFKRLLWSIYFGTPPCCPEVLDGVRSTCRGDHAGRGGGP
jgi:hypothetical protein